ncbi:MAG: hypothetical protein II671_01725, partial [Salinivirgaceae bacterium]|nr:hypothetical protein [Salinivirgaceae bacterium]
EESYKKHCEKFGNTHYRLSTDTFYMVYKKLGFSQGYPHGAIINKKGQIIKKYKAYYSNGQERIKNILIEEAAK